DVPDVGLPRRVGGSRTGGLRARQPRRTTSRQRARLGAGGCRRILPGLWHLPDDAAQGPMPPEVPVATRALAALHVIPRPPRRHSRGTPPRGLVRRLLLGVDA